MKNPIRRWPSLLVACDTTTDSPLLVLKELEETFKKYPLSSTAIIPPQILSLPIQGSFASGAVWQSQLTPEKSGDQSQGYRFLPRLQTRPDPDGATFPKPGNPFVETSETLTSSGSAQAAAITAPAAPVSQIAHYGVAEISEALRSLKLDRIVDVFVEHQVNGELLTSLDEGILQTDFGLSAFEARKLMMFAKENWRPAR